MLPNMPQYEAFEKNPVRNHSLKRAEWHDYHSCRIYMVTVTKHPGIPDFSRVIDDSHKGRVRAKLIPTDMWHILGRALKKITGDFPNLRLLQYVFMPDHAHLLFYVTCKVEYHLGDVILAFKRECSNQYKLILSSEYRFNFDGSVFTDGYHDRILSGEGQLEKLFDYMRDNPRRLLLRRSYPHYFNSRLSCQAGDQEFALYGNVCLLEHPEKKVVRFSRKYTAEQFEQYKSEWRETIRSRGVLVSPFIHKEEKAILKETLENGGRAVIICANGFPARWKPAGGYIEATAEGRLLFAGPLAVTPGNVELTRAYSMQMNEQAVFLAGLEPGALRLRKVGF